MSGNNKQLLSMIPLRSSDSKDLIYINPLGEYSSLAYKKDSIDITIKEGSRFRPVHISEVNVKLQNRFHNIYPFIVCKDEKYYLYNGNIDMNTVITDKDIEKNGVLVEDNWIESDLSNEDKSTLEKYKNNMDYYSYTTSKKDINILEGTTTIDILRVDSDSYTNIVSLSNLKSLNISTGVEAKVDLEIQYSLSNSSYGIFNHHTVFSAFECIEKGGAIITNSYNFIELVNNKVQIEYIDDIIRVLPISDDVTECIISNCIVTYGRL